MNILEKIRRKTHALTEDFWIKRRHVRIDKGSLHVGYHLPSSDFSKIPIIEGYANVGIVIQGPIDRNEDFTINTIRLFRHIYPDVKLVFSTWIGELNESEKLSLKEQNCELLELESCPAEDKGNGRIKGHLNNQLLSSLEGIRRLKEHRVDYALKIRSDVRLYKYDFIPYFIDLMRIYPCIGKKQKSRLLNISFVNSQASVPFHLSDFVWFGDVEDMEKLYAIPNRSKETLDKICNMSNEELESHKVMFWEKSDTFDIKDTDWLVATKEDEEIFFTFHEESYIMHTYATINEMCDERRNSLYAYYKFIKDNVIVVDETEIIGYWDKYNSSRNKQIFARFYQLRHSDWLNILLHFNNKE